MSDAPTALSRSIKDQEAIDKAERSQEVRNRPKIISLPENMAEEANAELETFRKQWQEEVSARAKASSSTNKSVKPAERPDRGTNQSINYTSKENSIHNEWRQKEDYLDEPHAAPYHDFAEDERRQPLSKHTEKTQPDAEASGAAGSALDYYEQAVERESQGSLGDSLRHTE